MGEQRTRRGHALAWLITAIALAASLLAFSPAASAADVVGSATFTGAIPDTATLTLDKCAGPGVLESVTIEVSADVQLDYKLETLAGAGAGTETASATSDVTVTLEGPGLVAPLQASKSVTSVQHDLEFPGVGTFIDAVSGLLTYAAPYGVTGSATDTAAQSQTFTGADMAAFSGPGTVEYTVTTAGAGVGNFPVFGNGWADVTNEVSAGVLSLTCTYADATPSIEIEKATNTFDADDAADAVELVEGDAIEWTYVVTNGEVAVENVAVTDDKGVAISCPKTALAADEVMECTGTGTAGATDLYTNIGTVLADPVGGGDPVTDADPSNYKARALEPAIEIQKATNGADADDPAGADVPQLIEEDAVVWTYVVKNTGEVPLNNVVVTDDKEGAICVYLDDPAAVLAVDASFECELSPTDGALLGDYANVGDVSGTVVPGFAKTGETVTDDDPSHYVARDVIDLSLVKTFGPASVEQGSAQSFTIEVTNAGPSDANDVLVTDMVDALLEVTGVSVTQGTGDCSASAGQNISCIVQIPDDPAPSQSVIITVDYVAAPTLGGPAQFGAVAGTEFRFVFENGHVLIGAAEEDVFLYAPDGSVTQLPDLDRKNDYPFTAPDGSAMLLHVSCSDLYPDGWGEAGGPSPDENPDWRIAEFSIARYNGTSTFFKYCGDVVSPFTVDNTATAAGADSNGPQVVTGDAMVTVTEPAQRVIVDNTCLDENGRIDVYIDNKREGEGNYVVTIGALERTATIAEGGAKKLSVTGRPDGTLDIVVTRDGEIVHTETVEVACDGDPVEPPADGDIVLTNTCFKSNGRLDITIVNNAAEPQDFVVTAEGANYLLERTRTVRSGRTDRVTFTGRPDGDVTVKVSLAGVIVFEEAVTVACDEPVGPPAGEEAVVTSRCLGKNGRIDVQVTNTTDVEATYTATFTGANYELVREVTVAAGRTTKMTVTGRSDGDVLVTVDRDTVEIASQTITVACD